MIFIENQFKEVGSRLNPVATCAALAFLVAFSLGGGAGIAFAGDSRMGIDQSVDLNSLASAPGRANVRSSVAQGRVRIDASAVLDRIDCTLLMRNSLDFDRYVSMGIPNLRASRIVDRTPDARFLYVWSHMVLALPVGEQSSKHFLEVESLPQGSRWQLVASRPSWLLPEDSRFDALDGSWYVIPFPGDPADCSRGRVYVRYFLSMDLNSSVPAGLVDFAVGKSLRSGVSGVIEALANHSRR